MPEANLKTLPATVTQPQLHLATLPAGLTKRLSDAQQSLAPAGAKTGTAELLACLVLVAPVGMSAQERQDWLSVARNTLQGIPADLLVRGCKAAREQADHPSKVVPLIMMAVRESWEIRKRNMRLVLEDIANLDALRLDCKPSDGVPYEVTQQILREVRESFRAGGE